MKAIASRDGKPWFELMAQAGDAIRERRPAFPGRGMQPRAELTDAEVRAYGNRYGLQVEEWDVSCGTLWMRGPKLDGRSA